MSDEGGRDQAWRDELIRLGGSIHQDEAEPLSDDEDAVQQAGIDRYLAMLDALDGRAIDPETIEAILWSLHPLDDYGIYEAAYGVLSQADPTTAGAATARVLPNWLESRGDHHSIRTGSMFVTGAEDASGAFLTATDTWGDAQRALVRRTVGRWVRDDEQWEPIHEALGGTNRKPVLDPIPDDWPEDWRSAAEAFRESGRVDRAWTNEKDFPSNFDRVFAIMELGHGARWREVPDFLNALLMRRRNELPKFIGALAALADDRRERIVMAVDAARPDTAEYLRGLLEER
ncbi:MULTISPECIES: hypothetical protein [Rhodococcus]|uniref:hypothetical protein n=1 Tax=Rhodococcus TaxID=1827 RepID=UPI000BC48961|nr:MULTISPECIES: hypothetical protein [Rhodococcus]MBP1159586.1 hypothetical protein [Rhodococcus sp. PvR099]MCZ4556569.1 hypothetical protein [Rhodococcus maanshanensis]PTR43585.1 hypothetical protein C8K38_107190 [Rhodococcus sp. OK611]SNX90930.1 hypothetical protein SAMN05447004_107190 [Rhodococcus sp. OK270]